MFPLSSTIPGSRCSMTASTAAWICFCFCPVWGPATPFSAGVLADTFANGPTACCRDFTPLCFPWCCRDGGSGRHVRAGGAGHRNPCWAGGWDNTISSTGISPRVVYSSCLHRLFICCCKTLHPTAVWGVLTLFSIALGILCPLDRLMTAVTRLPVFLTGMLFGRLEQLATPIQSSCGPC